jgi:hypothetical protein
MSYFVDDSADDALVAAILARLNVDLSTRASEATLVAIAAGLAATLDVALSTLATEATLLTRATEATLLTRATEATLLTRASEATLLTRATEATLLTRATEATLLTRATEATLLTRLSKADFEARINTHGQKTMAASTPVVLASDQSVITVAQEAASALSNGIETVVAAVAISVLAANSARKAAVIQNTGPANIRVGAAGVTAVTGVRLVMGASITFDMPYCPTVAIFAIRETGANSTVNTIEVT